MDDYQFSDLPSTFWKALEWGSYGITLPQKFVAVRIVLMNMAAEVGSPAMRCQYFPE